MNETYQQISNLIRKSKNILILTHARADCDGLGASLAAYLAFEKMGKKATVVTNDPAPENLKFLPSIDILHNSLGGGKDFVITVDSSKADIGKIKYNVEGKKVNIIITPKNGVLSAEDVSFGEMSKDYDLIIAFDTGNLEHLGALYEENTEMFFDIPIINIDHHASNTEFGQVNLVDVTAASATEVFYNYLAYLEEKAKKPLVDEDIATLLLAGIITDTGSFQHANTSPKSMEVAAKLLDLGARQQEVIKNIYKTKKLSTLKLWGTILSKIQVDPKHRMVWSSLSKEDFQEADAKPEETEGIIDDLLTNAPGAEVIFLIKQNADYVSVSMRSTSNQVDVGKLAADNGGGGHVRAAGFRVHEKKAFDQIVSDIITKVQGFQANRLGYEEHEEVGSRKQELDNGSETKIEENTESAEETTSETYLDFNAPEQELGNRKEEVGSETNKEVNQEKAEETMSEETPLFEDETNDEEDSIPLFEENAIENNEANTNENPEIPALFNENSEANNSQTEEPKNQPEIDQTIASDPMNAIVNPAVPTIETSQDSDSPENINPSTIEEASTTQNSSEPEVNIDLSEPKANKKETPKATVELTSSNQESEEAEAPKPKRRRRRRRPSKPKTDGLQNENEGRANNPTDQPLI